MTNPAGIDLATGEGVFVSTHGGGDLSLMLEVVCRGVALSRIKELLLGIGAQSISWNAKLLRGTASSLAEKMRTLAACLLSEHHSAI
jgi:hypothetical protein